MRRPEKADGRLEDMVSRSRPGHALPRVGWRYLQKLVSAEGGRGCRADEVRGGRDNEGLREGRG
jgi:hypothetical protein